MIAPQGWNVFHKKKIKLEAPQVVTEVWRGHAHNSQGDDQKYQFWLWLL